MEERREPAATNRVQKLLLKRPDLLNVLLLEPGGSKFFRFGQKKIDHINAHSHEALSQMARLWLSRLHSGPESLTVPRRKDQRSTSSQRVILFFHQPPESTL